MWGWSAISQGEDIDRKEDEASLGVFERSKV